jgi:hypothetical protein
MCAGLPSAGLIQRSCSASPIVPVLGLPVTQEYTCSMYMRNCLHFPPIYMASQVRSTGIDILKGLSTGSDIFHDMFL